MIKTSRCSLGLLKPEDFDDIAKLYCDETSRKYLGGVVSKENLTHKFDAMNEDKAATYFVVRSHNEDFLGLISFDAHHDGNDTELSYQFISQEHGKGYAIESIKPLLTYAKTKLNLSRLVSETQMLNTPSIKLLTKLGFTKEKEVERFGNTQGIYGLAL